MLPLRRLIACLGAVSILAPALPPAARAGARAPANRAAERPTGSVIGGGPRANPRTKQTTPATAALLTQAGSERPAVHAAAPETAEIERARPRSRPVRSSQNVRRRALRKPAPGPTPEPMAEAQHLRADPADPNKARFGERVTDRVAAFAGSWGFVGASIGAMVLSVLANTVGGMHYDPYPFIALNLAISV